MKDGILYVNGVEPNSSSQTLAGEIKDLFLKSTNNLEWLSPGDVVLLKPALNSPHPYPSTTHPLAMAVISKILKEKGAKVVIGDQSGIRSVLNHPGGVSRGKTRDNYIKSGMGTEEDNFKSFEEEGWDEGFYHYQSTKTPSWRNGFYLTRWIEKADHIINLPRLSTHSQAGATLGFKNMVGCLREDSRMEFHANGPYNFFIKVDALGSSLKSVNDHTGTFIEKIVEINDAVRDKLRSTLFVATKAQTTFGPDSQVLGIGRLKFAKANVVSLEPGLVFASRDPVAAESLALAIIKHLRKSLPALPRIYERLILFLSNNAVKVDKLPIKEHPYIKHSMDIGLGEVASQIEYKNVPVDLGRSFNDLLN
ncbi:MAG: DUF362 domain-containing protein [Methanobacteriaceae archaeon]|jgi:uncharacterized protein (DUF362 family)|nr:DUF362 domain-containing protein [Methanobacteriaceae archaeon]OPY24792.1 MAG: hypothetical protein A4E26_00122 [Methanobacterium sp. PtaU1.Bin097]